MLHLPPFLRTEAVHDPDQGAVAVVHSFDLPLADGGWRPVRSAVRAVLHAMLRQGFATDLVVGERGEGNRYAQYHCDPAEHAFYVEVVSNHHLAPEHHLSPRRELGLVERGWSPPAGLDAVDEEPTNFWRHATGVERALVAVSDLRRSFSFSHDTVIGLELFECAL